MILNEFVKQNILARCQYLLTSPLLNHLPAHKRRALEEHLSFTRAEITKPAPNYRLLCQTTKKVSALLQSADAFNISSLN